MREFSLKEKNGSSVEGPFLFLAYRVSLIALRSGLVSDGRYAAIRDRRGSKLSANRKIRGNPGWAIGVERIANETQPMRRIMR
jgi:hypothetical protein